MRLLRLWLRAAKGTVDYLQQRTHILYCVRTNLAALDVPVSRSFGLPNTLNTKAIKAEYKAAVLTSSFRRAQNVVHGIESQRATGTNQSADLKSLRRDGAAGLLAPFCSSAKVRRLRNAEI